MLANSDLYKKVIDKLEFEPRLDTSKMIVSTKDEGIVVLAGKVKSYAEKSIAEEAVKKIEGVKGIANDLEVDISAPYERTDEDIARSAINSLSNSVFVPSERIKVIVKNGDLTLSGDVDSYFEKKEAEDAVKNLYGVRSISNSIVIKPKAKVDAVEIKEKILKEFERLARLDAYNINVEVNDSQVTLKGTVRNFDEEDEAVKAAWSVLGVTDVIDKLEIIDESTD